jgi:thiosulfate dehydrogenase
MTPLHARVWSSVALILLLATPLLASANGAPPDGDAVNRGEYVARLGDCGACHTAANDQPFAGGKEINTPFGVIHSTNITPDASTGIGSYTFEQFERAMREGVAADGRNLYPVMPYPSFAKMNEQDMRALYAYLTRGVTPVKRANMDNDLKWPFSMRFGLSAWNMAFLDRQEYRPDPAKSAQWNRGAYIVQGPGHCGACHTPRGIGFQEKAMGQEGTDGPSYLSGSVIDAWHAPSLRRVWPAPEVAEFLKTGRNRHAAAYGTMTEVIHFSTQRFTDADLTAVGDYLASLSVGEVASPVAKVPATTPQQLAHELYKTRGGLGYVQFCSGCHRLDGGGVADLFPPLAENSSVQAEDPSSAIHVVLSGWKSAETERFPRGFWMPRFSSLTDQELAEILTFVRANWGNRGTPVTSEQISKLRGAIVLKAEEPSAFVTPRFADILQSPQADQIVYGMRLNLETKALLPGQVGDELACGSCHLNAGTVAKGSPYVGLSALFPAFQPRAGKIIDFKDRINGCMRRSMSGQPLDKGSPEMLAMVAFADWMKGNAQPKDAIPGRGIGKISDTIVPNAANGEQVYRNQCAVCHGDHGEGRTQADGTHVFPPLWGDASFNIGAGIARTYTAAAFVKSNMPIANSAKFPMGQGGLTDQEAVDVAEYFTHMPRPDFPDKVKDWPSGGKPKDSRY